MLGAVCNGLRDNVRNRPVGICAHPVCPSICRVRGYKIQNRCRKTFCNAWSVMKSFFPQCAPLFCEISQICGAMLCVFVIWLSAFNTPLIFYIEYSAAFLAPYAAAFIIPTKTVSVWDNAPKQVFQSFFHPFRPLHAD